LRFLLNDDDDDDLLSVCTYLLSPSAFILRTKNILAHLSPRSILFSFLFYLGYHSIPRPIGVANYQRQEEEDEQECSSKVKTLVN